MKTIKELSDSLNISKEALYKKLKVQLKTELKEHIVKRKNITYIDDIGEKIIADSLKVKSTSDANVEKSDIDKPKTSEPRSDSASNFEPNFQPDFVPDFQVETKVQSKVESQAFSADYIAFLREQIAEKDAQIQRLSQLNLELVQTFQNEQKLQIQSNVLSLSEMQKQDEDKNNDNHRSLFKWLFSKKQS